MTRQEMIDDVWDHVDPSIRSYSGLIADLLDAPTD
jgi:hypothetical protein